MTELPKAITFDCYGTLIDWETDARAALEPIASRQGADLDALVAAWLEEDERNAKTLRDGAFLAYHESLVVSLSRAAERLGVELRPGEERALADSAGSWPPWGDGVRDLLAELRGRTVTAIVSNTTNAILAGSLRQIGVPVHATFVAEDARCYKPDHRMFHRALDGLGLKPDEVLHVAESIWADLEPCAELGIPTVWVDRAFRPEPAQAKPTHTIREFHALGALLGL